MVGGLAFLFQYNTGNPVLWVVCKTYPSNPSKQNAGNPMYFPVLQFIPNQFCPFGMKSMSSDETGDAYVRQACPAHKKCWLVDSHPTLIHPASGPYLSASFGRTIKPSQRSEIAPILTGF